MPATGKETPEDARDGFSSESTTESRSRYHLPLLDVYRGVAILFVFAHHVVYWSHGFAKIPWNDRGFRSLDVAWENWAILPLTLGHGGVAAFFVISGFCIHLSHVRATERAFASRKQLTLAANWGLFSWRRFWRIYPPYIIAGCLFLVTDVLTGQLRDAASIVKQGSTHAFLIHNFFESTMYGINPSLWSIAVEVQLYAVFPVLWWLLRGVGMLSTMAIVAFIELTIRSLIAVDAFPAQGWWRLVSQGPFAYWFSWSLGAWLCHNWLVGHRGILNRAPIVVGISLVAMTWFFQVADAFFFTAVAILTSQLLSRQLPAFGTAPVIEAHMITRILSLMGIISYSLYLFHQPFISAAHACLIRLVPDASQAFTLFALLATLVPIGMLSLVSYYAIEKRSVVFGNWLALWLSSSSVKAGRNCDANPA